MASAEREAIMGVPRVEEKSPWSEGQGAKPP